MNLKNGIVRYASLIAFTAVIFAAYAFCLFKMQIIDNDYYKEQSE